jgi:hypothetical protein
MRWMKWAGLAAVTLLIVACFLPWVTIASRNIVVSGVDTTGTTFGKPAYFHFFFCFFFIAFTFIPRIWAKRINLLVVAMNMAWAVRNYFIISTCRGGECPEKHNGIYLMLLASIVMLLSALFPDIKLPQQENKKQ